VDVLNRLNNSGDGVTLKDAAGRILDQMSYSGTERGMSWGRWPDMTGEFQLLEPTLEKPNSPPSQPSPSPSPSAGPGPPSPSAGPTASPGPSASPSPSTSSQSVGIDRIMACPASGRPEWVQLRELAGQATQLDDWLVRDVVGNSFQFSTSLAAGGTVQVQLNRHFLNNSGDTVELVTADNRLVDTAGYTSCQTGLALIKLNGRWVSDGEADGAAATTAESSSASANASSATTGTTSATTTTGNSDSSPNGGPANLLAQSLLNARRYLRRLRLNLAGGNVLGTETTLQLTGPELPTKISVVSVILGGTLISTAGWLLKNSRFAPSHSPDHADGPDPAPSDPSSLDYLA